MRFETLTPRPVEYIGSSFRAPCDLGEGGDIVPIVGISASGVAIPPRPSGSNRLGSENRLFSLGRRHGVQFYPPWRFDVAWQPASEGGIGLPLPGRRRRSHGFSTSGLILQGTYCSCIQASIRIRLS